MLRPVHILCVDQFSNIGGGQRSLLDILPAFSNREWGVSAAVPAEGPLTEKLRSIGVRTDHLACGSYSSKRKPLSQFVKYARELPKLVDALAGLVDTQKIDLLYVNGPRLVPAAAWVAWRKGIPLVFHCHNRLLQYSAITLTGQALELASAHVIGCCNYVTEPLRDYIAPERLHILYNGVADMVRGARPCTREKSRWIGVVGRIEEEKGQLEFVQAARAVVQHHAECRFKIIGTPMFSGDDYNRKVVACSKGLPIDFLGWRDDVAGIYAELDLLVVPSFSLEATTRVILEAYSAGVPVVAFPSGGIPEILEDKVTGFLAGAPTAAALADRILSVLRMDKEELDPVIRRARNEWNKRFTLQAYRNGVCEVLAQALQPAIQNTCNERALRRSPQLIDVPLHKR